MTTSAVVFDFNGTLSDDEPLLYQVYAELFADAGRPLSEREYLDELAGETEEEIVRRWLGRDDPELIVERIARYIERARDGTTVDQDVRGAVRFAAGQMPVAIVSAATLPEIEAVVAAADLGRYVTAIVSADDVANGKPHPEPYLRAAEVLDVPAAEVLVFEDTEAGVASAKAAGMRVAALTRTLGRDRLAEADELLDRIDVAAVRRLIA